MRIPFVSLFITSPFDGLQEHSEKVKECAWAFQQAIECHVTDKCDKFEDFRLKVAKLESEADAIKRRIRGHIPKGTMMPVDKFQLFMFIKEQDKVLDSVEAALDWISFREESKIPNEIEKEFSLLIEAVIEPIEELSEMVAEARNYFKTFSKKQRDLVKKIIHNMREKEHEADKIEQRIKHTIFSLETDSVTVFHIIRLVEIIGSIADHAENAADMMRAMIAR